MSYIEYVRTLWLCGATPEEAQQKVGTSVEYLTKIWETWSGEARRYQVALIETTEPAKIRVGAQVTKLA